jgi:hypothetical protein
MLASRLQKEAHFSWRLKVLKNDPSKMLEELEKLGNWMLDITGEGYVCACKEGGWGVNRAEDLPSNSLHSPRPKPSTLSMFQFHVRPRLRSPMPLSKGPSRKP